MGHRQFALIAGLLAIATPAQGAHGTLELRWNSCDGPIEHCATAEGPNTLYASVIGIDQPHRGYEVQLILGDPTTLTVPDAWRFDGTGCQGSDAVQVDHLPPADLATACPAFQGTAFSEVYKGVQLVPDYLPPQYARTLLWLFLANQYPSGQPAADPAKRYHLVRFVFGHSRSVSGASTPGVACGGLETALQFRAIAAGYLDPVGNEHYWSQEPNPLTSEVRGACVPVAAVNSTWGAIKGQYRR